MPQGLWKTKVKKESEGPDWEVVANSPETLIEVGEKLKRSKKPADQRLADLASPSAHLLQVGDLQLHCHTYVN